MSSETERLELLEPFARLSVIRFIEKMEATAEGERAAPLAAFWALMYASSSITHETAVAVAGEIETSDKRVRDFINGWRPSALAK